MSSHSINFYLNSKSVNKILYKLKPSVTGELVNTTGHTLIYRLKKNIENSTIPLLEVIATPTTQSDILSEGYFTIDLTTLDISGVYYFEIEWIKSDGSSTFFDISPKQVLIQTRLDNN